MGTMTLNRLLNFLGEDSASPHIATTLGVKVTDKEQGTKMYVSYMLDRTTSMFQWTGLPDTIPDYMLEAYLQIFGYAAFVRIDETNAINTPQQISTPAGVYIMFGGVGGERDIYYRPKLFTAANPRIKKSVQSIVLYPNDEVEGITNPCVIMPNDHNFVGLLPLYNRYAQQLVENDISIHSAQINARAQVGISCTTDRDKETARKYLDDLEAGKLGIIGETAFLDGVKVANVSTQSSNTIIQLIELQQYLKASWYNELGLNVNFNMKREYMSEEEIAVNTDILLPLVDDMYNCRVQFAEMVNKVFGLNISVEKSSAWANKEQEELAALAEASNSGEIPLSPQIADRIADAPDNEGGEKGADEVSPDVPEPVQSQLDQSDAGTESDAPIGGDEPQEPASGASESAEEDAADNCGEPANVINLEVNIDTKGGEADVDVSVPEPEAHEEPEEPDAEPDAP